MTVQVTIIYTSFVWWGSKTDGSHLNHVVLSPTLSQTLTSISFHRGGYRYFGAWEYLKTERGLTESGDGSEEQDKMLQQVHYTATIHMRLSTVHYLACTFPIGMCRKTFYWRTFCTDNHEFPLRVCVCDGTWMNSLSSAQRLVMQEKVTSLLNLTSLLGCFLRSSVTWLKRR